MTSYFCYRNHKLRIVLKDLSVAFPFDDFHVLVIDATYKTNIYNLPFVQIVGMTSTNQTFCIAHAFISAEKVENYVWMLEQLKSILEPGMEPCVIVTDRELALMSACTIVFPKVKNNLCRFHANQIVISHLIHELPLSTTHPTYVDHLLANDCLRRSTLPLN